MHDSENVMRNLNSIGHIQWSDLIHDPYVKAAFERAKDDPHDPAPVEPPGRPRYIPGGETARLDLVLSG
jgi:hypothetical protein